MLQITTTKSLAAVKYKIDFTTTKINLLYSLSDVMHKMTVHSASNTIEQASKVQSSKAVFTVQAARVSSSPSSCSLAAHHDELSETVEAPARTMKGGCSSILCGCFEFLLVAELCCLIFVLSDRCLTGDTVLPYGGDQSGSFDGYYW